MRRLVKAEVAGTCPDLCVCKQMAAATTEPPGEPIHDDDERHVLCDHLFLVYIVNGCILTQVQYLG